MECEYKHSSLVKYFEIEKNVQTRIEGVKFVNI